MIADPTSQVLLRLSSTTFDNSLSCNKLQLLYGVRFEKEVQEGESNVTEDEISTVRSIIQSMSCA